MNFTLKLSTVTQRRALSSAMTWLSEGKLEARKDLCIQLAINSSIQTFLKTKSSDSVYFSLRQSLVVHLHTRYSPFEKSIISSPHAHSDSPSCVQFNCTYILLFTHFAFDPKLFNARVIIIRRTNKIPCTLV